MESEIHKKAQKKERQKRGQKINPMHPEVEEEEEDPSKEEGALPAFAHAAERTHSSATESTFFFFEYVCTR